MLKKFSSRNNKMPSTDVEDGPKIVNINKEQTYSFCSNFVKTAKYSILSFLPLFFVEEFHYKKKFANLYFLVVSCAETIGPISNTNGIPMTLIPLTFVVIVDAIFQILEDFQRHRADREANARPSLVYRPETKSFEETQWNALQVGDIIKVQNYEQIPADLCLLGVEEAEPSNPSGLCYVETKNLDGETNLKLRQCAKDLVGCIQNDEDVSNFSGSVEMEQPNTNIDTFLGTLKLEDTQNHTDFGVGLETTNLLLRGCVLRNTGWAIAVVLNTGRDTKIVMSSNEAPSKNSTLEHRINTEIKLVVPYLIFFSLFGALGGVIWSNENIDTLGYLHWDLSMNASVGEFFIQVFYYLLLLKDFIPVALYVSMGICKFFQSYFINQDIDMYHEASDTPALVRTFALNEELGQITHIFSDKTGTLTENIMSFRKCSIGGMKYGRGITAIGKDVAMRRGESIPQEDLEAEDQLKEQQVPHVSFCDDAIFRDLEERSDYCHGQKKKVNDFFRVLSLCHTVIPEKIEGSDEIRLSASSPDEEALVCGAKFFGWDFRDRRNKCATVFCKASNKLETFDILEIIEFDSTRKRMSVIVRTPSKEVMIFSKGADTTIYPLLKSGQDGLEKITTDHLEEFSTEGLRTLVIAQATLDEMVYSDWQRRYSEASADIEQRHKKRSGEENEIDKLTREIEQNLTLLGCTAIEDKLQDEVPETISGLAQAGIKLWVLTGDKEETAINIGFACQLIQPADQMRMVKINKHTADCKEKMQRLLKEEVDLLNQETSKSSEALSRCLVIDGRSLTLAFDETIQPSVEQTLLQFSKECKTVIGCRVSPEQKKKVVAFVKKHVQGVRSLSIGDGANDVPMIQEAHVGVGISGQEGLQAVNSSDYAIAQFRFLRKLLLVHGRWNYRRMSKLVCYMFYKSTLMTLPMFFFTLVSGFGGQKIVIDIGIIFFNTFYTALPIILLGIYDQDISADIVLRYPDIYMSGINDEYFRHKIFWVWMLSATWESCLIAILPLYAVQKDFLSFWEAGTLTMTASVVVTNLKICFHQYKWTSFHVFIWLVCTGSWLLSAWGTNVILFVDYNYHGEFNYVVGLAKFWFCLILVIVIALMRDIVWKFYNRWFNPKVHHIVEEIDAFNLPEPQERNALNPSQRTKRNGYGVASVKVTQSPPEENV